MAHDVRALIGGEWISGRRTGDNVNPADSRDRIGTYPILDPADVRTAVDAAERALPAWRATPAPQRARVLARVAELLTERVADIAAVITREEGKTLAESKSELHKAATVLSFMAGEGYRIAGQTLPSESAHRFIYTLRQPLGVVGVITPWNFPVSIPAWKIAPALVSGNTVVFKPACLTPWSSELLSQLFVDAGLPPGALNVVYGPGQDVGRALVTDRRVRGISFTGSTEVGLELYATAAARGARVQCEMGGKNPLVVLDDADVTRAAGDAVRAAFGQAGQRCTATSRVIVMDSVADELIEAMLTHTRSIVIGPGTDTRTDVGPLVDEDRLASVLGYVALGRSEGAQLLHGGARLTGGAHAHGNYMSPAIFDHVTADMRIAREEIFGPVMCVLRVHSYEEAVRVANDVDYGLSSAVYTRDTRKLLKFASEVQSGVVHGNAPTMGGEGQIPFGGVKASSVGYREMGSEALDFYTELKSVYLDLS